jgi:hypothetical protein
MDNFIPLKFVLTQRESKQNVDDLQLFDHDKLMTHFWYRREKNKEVTELANSLPIPRYFQDSYASLFLVRGLPLKIGDLYEFPIVSRGKIWILEAKVDAYDTISIDNRDVKAIRIKAVTHFPGILKKQGDILFWYSADEKRTLLKFSAKVKIGSIEGEIYDYYK